MKKRNRLLAILLTAIMTISMLPSAAFATEAVDTGETAESAVVEVSSIGEEQDAEAALEEVPAVEETTEETVQAAEEDEEAEEAEAEEAEAEEAEAEETAEPAAEAEEEAAPEEAAEAVEWPITLLAKGDDYIVTVTFDETAGLPADAQVSVEEILSDDKVYDDYVEQAADKIEADVENLSYVRLFDISLVDADGGKLEPTGPVDVKIRLKDVEKADEATQVVHFAGEEEIPEIIDTEIKDKDVSFETDGFSIYAVLTPGEEGGEARLGVTFVLNNGDDEIFVLVKPDDITDGEFEKIVYDPGIPEAEGKKFMGWTSEENFTDETTPMSFDEVRADIQEKLASVKEGDTVTYYAMMFNAFELYYVNENNVLFNTVSLMSTADSVTTDVTQEYSVTGSTDGFVGWVEQGTETPVYKVGDSIAITTAHPQVVLTPKLGPGKWLYFDGNDGGSTAADTASYTPPAFIPQDTPATDYEPANPTRLGYTFDGWYTEAEDGKKFDFSQTLTEDKTVYAHWIPNPEAQYTVIVWAQSVDDNWDTEDADKTYDYVESQKFTVATGTQITEDLLRQDGFLSKTDSDFGVTDLKNGSKAFQYRTFEVKNGVGSGKDEVSAMGDTVVNVYYDRKIMTIEFVDAPGGTSQTYYEPVDEVSGTTVYGFVDGQYVPLTVTADRYIEWYRSATATSTTFVGELETVYYSPGIGQTSLYDTADINIASAQIGTQADTGGNPAVYYRGYSGNPNTLSTSTSASPYYRDSAKNTRVYPVVSLRNATYSYNGQPYTGQLYQQKTVNALVYTGLYGQSLSKYGYEWPESTNGWEHIAYIGSFNGSLFGHSGLGGKANKISTSPGSSTTNTTIIFYVQDPENESNYTQVATAGYKIASDLGFMITERFLGSEPSGYRWTTSSTMPTTWTSGTAVDSEGYTTEHRGSNTYLHIKYDRVKNDIVFMQGSETVRTIKDIPYGKNLSEYEDDVPEAPEVGENEYFYGWYEDPEGTTKVKWNENMPLGNKVIYGITAPVQYHVIIEMNADGDTVDFGGASQRTEFWLDYGETISGANLMRAIRTNSEGDSYSIIGYYTENAAAGQFDNNKLWNFDAKITEQSLWHKYTGPDDPLRDEYGDYAPEFESTVGIFKLFASWRDDSLINSGGIHIRYNDGTETFVDPYGYADMATVIVKSEQNEANCPKGKYFVGWKLGDVVYLPGQTFSAAKDAAVKESDGYYITLTAEYADKEEKTPTHINWYWNYDGSEEDEDFDPIYHVSDYLDINVGAPIPAAPSRDGFKFLGWYKGIEKENLKDDPITSYPEVVEPNFLDYRNETYYLHGTEKEVGFVAADEVTPYEGLYAVWESTQYYIYHSLGDGPGELAGPYNIDENTVAGDLWTKVLGKIGSGSDAEFLYAGYYDYDETASDKKGGVITENITTKMPENGKTYYVKEISVDYLKPQIYLIRSKVYGNKDDGWLIQKLYAFVNIDAATDYNKCGFVINGSEQSEDSWATEGIAVQQKNKDGSTTNKTLNASSLFGMDSCNMTYTDLGDKLAPGDSFRIGGYYVTPDGVMVNGKMDRVVVLSNTTPRTDGKPVWTGWAPSGNTSANLVVNETTYPTRSTSMNSAQPMMVKRMLTISAPAEKIGYKITKVYDSATEEQTVEGGNYAGQITYEPKDGFMFAGWYKDAAFAEPADFTDVSADMTVYAKYVSNKDVTVAFRRKSKKSDTTTFNATISVKNSDQLENVTVNVNDSISAVLANKTVKKTGSGNNIKYTTQYKGTIAVKGLSIIDTFTASVSWTTPDGTFVTGADKNCSYYLGSVIVR